jgi:hypothetical protein
MYLINDISRTVNLSQKRIREYEKEGFISLGGKKVPTTVSTQTSRWQRSCLSKRGFPLACLRNLLVRAPCWNVFACLERESCAAYHQPHRRCYEIRQ